MSTFIISIIIINMAEKEKQRLEFKVYCSQNQQKIGANKMINPLNLIPKETLDSTSKESQEKYEFAGTFVNDYILAQDGPEKGKRIYKADKRAHYKTRMCPYGRQCKKQLTCTFAHTQLELRKPFMKRKTVCKLYQMGKCHLGAVCREYHGNMDLMKKNYKYKTQICKDFLQGKCGKGNVCIYIHEMINEDHQSDIDEEAQEINQNDEKVIETKVNFPNTKQGANKIQKDESKTSKPNTKKQIVEVVEQKIGEQKFVEDGFSFSFNFN